MKRRLNVGIALVVLVGTTVFLWFSYVPEHWLRHVSSFAQVTVDDRPAKAEAYLGNPTDDEAETFLLVNISGVGDYLFNFEEESYRQVSSREFVRLRGGALTLKPMNKGKWLQPLPFRNVNEFRVASPTGRLIIVRF
jgi:hypothetical protein